MERFFNTAGPIKPELHYNIDPLKRFDLEELLLLVRQQNIRCAEGCFLVHENQILS